MKLSELTKAVAEARDLRAKVVTAVQEETFRQIRAAVEKGERVQVPEFGVFVGREPDSGGGEKTVGFRPAGYAETGGEPRRRKRERRNPRENSGRSRSGKARRRAAGNPDGNSERKDGAIAAEAEADAE